MYHVYYEHVRELHKHRHRLPQAEMELNGLAPKNIDLRNRSRLYLSDILLKIGQLIRPAEFQVHFHVGQAHEGTLEIKAEGC
ncbi:MAG: hypothetical protein JSW42_09870 [Chloroflexota bacterium]|nr:MAG: hypothetical protein JSW42_09870 [Chloroflexota bacterium]